MARFSRRLLRLLPLAVLATLPASVAADQILFTNGFQSCMQNSQMTVNNMYLSFDKDTNMVVFDVSGTNEVEQNVVANLSITAYGKQVYTNSFDPCGSNPHVPQLCPVPAGTFSAVGNYTIPASAASEIPSIAFNIPNLDGVSTLELSSPNGGPEVACLQADITNGKTANVPAAQWAIAGIAGAAFVASGLGAASSAVSGSSSGPASPSFMETMFFLQGVSMNGMMSVDYPSVYRSFTSNFAFSIGLVHWNGLEESIDTFRANTGGNLTASSVQELNNSTLIFQQGGPNNTKRSLFKRAASLVARQVTTTQNGQQTNVGGGADPATTSTAAAPPAKNQKLVTGIQAYVEEVSVPSANTFMTALLIFAIVLAAVTASILLFKVILEAWALFGTFPKNLTKFRKNYWWLLARTITNLILLLYGVWALYCIYQFREGDSVAAKVLAGVTFAIFTAVLVGFTLRVFYIAHRSRKEVGDASELYNNREVWRKYRIFYDSFKRGYFWLFVPTIVFMFLRGAILAAADGQSSDRGLVQTGALLIVDGVFLIMLVFFRPYHRKSGNWINIVIQVVRVLSVACVLVFVEKLGFSQTTKTVTGVVLIVVQAALTGLLGILIAVNALINCIKMNPHRRKRNELEKQRDGDNLTPLDAHNSLLMYPLEDKQALAKVESIGTIQHARGRSKEGYDLLPLRDVSNERLIGAGASVDSRQPQLPSLQRSDYSRNASVSSFNSMQRHPQLPDLDYKPTMPGVAL